MFKTQSVLKFLCVVLMVVGCAKEAEVPELVPEILSLEPEFGETGDTVSVFLKDFEEVLISYDVLFGGVRAKIISSEVDEVRVVTPEGAETGEVSINVGVTKIAGPLFTFTPSISMMSPTTLRRGDTLSILGRHFSKTNSDNLVKFNFQTSADPFYSDTELMLVKIPNSTVSGKVSVSVGDHQTVSTQEISVVEEVGISTEGLVFFAPFGANVNSIVNGIQSNSSNSKVPDRFETPDKARGFNGTNQAIYYRDELFKISKGITVSVWVRANDDTPGGIVTHDAYRISLRNKVFSGAVFIKLGEQKYVLAESPMSTYMEGWQHLAFTYDLKTFTTFWNGKKMISKEWIGESIVDRDQEVFIGKSIGGDFFSGDIDDVTIYNRALSESEILQLFEQNESTFTP
ncbi:MAG: LamG-like jellyroll fold domain-containing protein [Imperialibacter sp.]|uniref:LamG-like jellyroll fold domain-containing protein n=1 Tax=Imperialibacter sp. TaxID=2038411 RepID=UPI0032EAC1AE